jgi:Na+/H+ antiporter NhaD/arsenite permease-like protein
MTSLTKFHLSIPVIALVGASLILILGRVKPYQVIKNEDWVWLLFFASLFIVVDRVVICRFVRRVEFMSVNL